MRSAFQFASLLAVFLLATFSGTSQCGSGGCPQTCASGCCDGNGNCLDSCDASGGGGGESPIVIDVSGNGFHLTSPADGVLFDFFGTGKKLRVAWTAKGSENGWLVLDRDHNGKVDNAKEMFGNLTFQPDSEHRNGFLALAVFDMPENGGNGDGVIDARDSIYHSLRIWVDKNHNGISELGELYTLPDLDIVAISLDYSPSHRVDDFGNVFRYRSKLVGAKHSDVDRWMYDVFLQMTND